MRRLLLPVAAVSALTSLTVMGAPAQAGVAAVPERSEVVYLNTFTGQRIATPNQFEARPANSLAKLYLASYVLHFGDHSPRDLADIESMIRLSDDRAADWLDFKYPGAINKVAGKYRLGSTHADGYWGDATTSAADVVSFLSVIRTDPTSGLIDLWMNAAAPVAADGTAQNWGTARIPGALASKWGWSDGERQSVDSASMGLGFVAASMTDGSPDDQTADVLAALR